MTDVSWARHDGEDCLRLGGLGVDGDVAIHVEVVPRAGVETAVGIQGLPPMAGRLIGDGDDSCFVPRFAFLEGTTYRVVVDGVAVVELVRPRPDRAATTEVVEIDPTATEVPRNLLRFAIRFSSPMSEGSAAEHLRLVSDAGDELVGALLPTGHELWDPSRTRLTVLLDPARIKRGLVGHREVGYPLRPGTAFRLVVDGGFLDARGVALRAMAERRFEVGADERRHVDPERWSLTIPTRHTIEPLDVGFDRPLDASLLDHCLAAIGPDGAVVTGTARVGLEARSWGLVPGEGWAPGPHRLVVDPMLEDLAGNSVGRVFDRDLSRREDEPRHARPVSLAFEVR